MLDLLILTQIHKAFNVQVVTLEDSYVVSLFH